MHLIFIDFLELIQHKIFYKFYFLHIKGNLYNIFRKSCNNYFYKNSEISCINIHPFRKETHNEGETSIFSTKLKIKDYGKNEFEF